MKYFYFNLKIFSISFYLIYRLSYIVYLIFFYITFDSSIESNFDWLTLQDWDQAVIVCISYEIIACKILFMLWT